MVRSSQEIQTELNDLRKRIQTDEAAAEPEKRALEEMKKAIEAVLEERKKAIEAPIDSLKLQEDNLRAEFWRAKDREFRIAEKEKHEFKGTMYAMLQELANQ
jgi:hypothetical protein